MPGAISVSYAVFEPFSKGFVGGSSQRGDYGHPSGVVPFIEHRGSLRRGMEYRRSNSWPYARGLIPVSCRAVPAHEIWCRRSKDRSNAMTMDAQVRSQRFGVYLQPAHLRTNIEFGVDPAIEADGARHASFDRRRVSLRWFSGTLLTGLSGAALIGSAIYAALGHQTYFAEAPAPSHSQRTDITLDFGVHPHKGDRLVTAADLVPS